MRKLFFIIGTILLLSLSVFAKPLEKKHIIESKTIQLVDGRAVVSLHTNLLFDTLMGEPVVSCSGTWKFHYAIIDSKRYDSSNLPPKVINEITLFNVEILYNVGSNNVNGLILAGIGCDPGVFSKSDSSTKSYTTPSSTDWNKTFYVYNDTLGSAPLYYKEKEAKAHMRVLKQEGTLSPYINADDIFKASLNISSIHRFIKKKEKEEEKKKKAKEADDFEDLLDDTESSPNTNSNSNSEYNELFDDTPNENHIEESFENMLSDTEDIKIYLYSVPSFTSKNVITINGSIKNMSSIDASSIKFKLNGLTQNVYLNKNGSFSNKMVLFNGKNKIDIVYESNGIIKKKSVTVNSTTKPVKARFTLTWDSTNSDMDLHVYGPSNSHCSYNNKKTANMTLDVDNTKGYGPENISVKLNQYSGTYRIFVKHYAKNSGYATLYVYLDNKLVATQREYLSEKEKWHAYDLEID